MVVDQPYSTVHSTNRYRVRELANTNESLKHLILSLYRSLLFNIDDRTQKTYRQLACAAQVSFLINKFDIEIQARVNNPTFYEIPYIWQTVFEPPVIFYTRSIKRKGIFPVKNKNYLHKIKLDKENMYGLPIMVGDLLIVIYVEVDFLELGAGIANLFEIAEPEEFTGRKPDGFVLFGLPEEQFAEDEMRGVVFKEDGVYYGMLPNIDEMDYFGYMKKMVLTVHNLIRIDRGSLPVHGAFARIITKQNNKANIMLIGDSGAGKSETLEAINKLPEEYNAKVDILIDDMGSLHINEEGDITAVGTEIGAFVRLDDLTPGYAYNTMDRSIFMNPNVVNARVIVPQMTYENISTPTRVDYLFYINNFEEIGEDKPVLYFFDNLDEAYDTFAEGMRMAKGTTGEVGITTSYFANPFGAVQRRGVHETIARRYFNQMEINGIHIGTIRTQLGIPGYEQNGPIEAAKALIDFINET
jgi:cytochrome c556